MTLLFSTYCISLTLIKSSLYSRRARLRATRLKFVQHYVMLLSHRPGGG